MVLIGFPRLARSTLSTASSDGGVSHWRLPKRSRPLYFIVRDRRSPIRLTDSRTPSSPTRISSPPRGCMENVHRGGHTESIPPPNFRFRWRIFIEDSLVQARSRRASPSRRAPGECLRSSFLVATLCPAILDCPDCTVQHPEPS